MITLEEAFGKVLQQQRKARNLSQKLLASETGLDRTFISLLERGKRRPTINTLFQLAYILGVKPAELITEVDKYFNERCPPI